MKVFTTALLLVILCYTSLSAQILSDSKPTLNEYLDDSRIDDSTDNIGRYAGSPIDTTKTQAPTLALFKSLFIPGWGQISNKKYIKAGVVITLEGILIGTVVHYTRRTNRARDAFDDARAKTPDSTTLIAELFNDYDYNKDRKNYFSWITGTVIFISMFDAYVDAHLSRFPKYGGNLSFEMIPEGGQDIRAKLSYHF